MSQPATNSRLKRLSLSYIPDISDGFANRSGYGSSTSSSSVSSPTEPRRLFSNDYKAILKAIPQYPDPLRNYDSSKISDFVEKSRGLLKACRLELGSQSEKVTEGCKSFASLRKFVGAQRLRDMPDEGSLWDSFLKWVLHFGEKVEVLESFVQAYFAGSEQLLHAIWGSCKTLLLLGEKNALALHHFFDELYRFAVFIENLEPHKEIFSSSLELQETMSAVFMIVLELAIRVTMHYKRYNSITTRMVEECDVLITSILKNFPSYRESLELAIWLYRLRMSPEVQGTGSVSLSTLKVWIGHAVPTAPQVMWSEDTCLWFERTLTQFKEGSDQLLVVYGAAGCGKTVLSNWIVNRLRMHRDDILIHYSLDPSVENGATSLTIVRSLLSQLLNKRVGDVELYKRLVTVYTAALLGPSPYKEPELEKALWTAFETTAVSSKQLNIVLDGLDSINGGTTKANEFLGRIKSIIERNGRNSLNCVVLSQNMLLKPSVPVKEFLINKQDTIADIRSFVTNFIKGSSELGKLSETDKTDIIDGIVAKSAGSFLAATLLIQTIRRFKTLDEIRGALGSSVTDGVTGLLDILFRDISFGSATVRRTLCWLLVSEQPMQLETLKELLEIVMGGNQKARRVPRLSWDLEADILKPCGSLLTVERGIIRFTHPSLKDHLIARFGSNQLGTTIEECHTEVFLSMMAYIVATELPTRPEADFEAIPLDFFDALLAKSGLLIYCARFWIHHLKKSRFWKNGKVESSKELTDQYPTTIAFPRFEAAVWIQENFTELHFIEAAAIRKEILRNTAATIHSMMNLSRFRSSIGEIRSSVDIIHECWSLSKSCYGIQSLQTKNLALLYCKVSVKFGFSTSSEEVYKWIWSFHKDTQTPIDKDIVGLMKEYARGLIGTNRVTDARDFYHDLWKTCVSTFGELHEITTEILELMIQAMNSDEDIDRCIEICTAHLKIYEKDQEPWEKGRLRAVIRLSSAYERKGDITQAAKTLFNAIQALATFLGTPVEDKIINAQGARIELILELAKLYERHSMNNQVQLFKDFWVEIGAYVGGLRKYSNELITLLVTLAEAFEKATLETEAEDLYSALWNLFKLFPELFNHPLAFRVGGCLARLRGKRKPGSEEEILKEILEFNGRGKTITQQEVEAYLLLSKFYEEKGSWTQLLDICKGGLQRIWPQILRTGETAFLPDQYQKPAIQLSYLLALAYSKSSDLKSAGDLYRKIYESCRKSMMIVESEVIRAVIAYCDFLVSTSSSEKAVEVYKDLFESLSTSLTIKNPQTILVGIQLVVLYGKLNHLAEAEATYLQLWDSLSTSDPMEITFKVIAEISKLYADRKELEGAEKFYRLVFVFLGRIKTQLDFVPDSKVVFDVYNRLVLLLKLRNTPVAEIKDLTEKLRAFYLLQYGDRHIAYLKAVYLFGIFLEEQSNNLDAIAQFDWLLKTMSAMPETPDIITMMADVKKRLALLYSKTPGTGQKAEDIYRDLFNGAKRDGVAGEKSLGLLKLLIEFLKSQGRCEDANKTLEAVIIDILSTEENPHTLYDSAKLIASLYHYLETREEGQRLTEALRKFFLQFSNTRGQHNDARFKTLIVREINGFITDRSYQIFLSTLEQILFDAQAPSKVADLFLVILKTILKETELHEVWLRSAKVGDRLDLIISAGSKLRSFLLSQRRPEEAEYIYTETWKIFLGDFKSFMGKYAKPAMKPFADRNLEAFFIRCMEECVPSATFPAKHIIQVGINQVEVFIQATNINDAFTIALWCHSWIKAEGKWGNVLRLLFLLTSSPVKNCSDMELRRTIALFTEEILGGILSGDSGIAIPWISMEIEEINRLLILLGSGSSWKFILEILKHLWDDRVHHDDTWSPGLVTAIGRRLCDAYMALEDRENAIRMCERIYYNYSRVWGLLNPKTLSFGDLLSQIYASSQRYEKAMVMNDRILQALRDPKCKSEIKEQETQKIIFRQLDLLKYLRNMKGGWLNPEENYVVLISDLQKLYMQKHSRWDEVANFKLWSTKAVEPGEVPFLWTRPELWNILEEVQVPAKSAVPTGNEIAPLDPSQPKRHSKSISISGSVKESDFETFSKTSFAFLFST